MNINEVRKLIYKHGEKIGLPYDSKLYPIFSSTGNVFSDGGTLYSVPHNAWVLPCSTVVLRPVISLPVTNTNATCRDVSSDGRKINMANSVTAWHSRHANSISNGKKRLPISVPLRHCSQPWQDSIPSITDRKVSVTSLHASIALPFSWKRVSVNWDSSK